MNMRTILAIVRGAFFGAHICRKWTTLQHYSYLLICAGVFVCVCGT